MSVIKGNVAFMSKKELMRGSSRKKRPVKSLIWSAEYSRDLQRGNVDAEGGEGGDC